MSEQEIKKEKKPFDSTNSFTFFGNWVETIEALETEQDAKSSAYQLFKAIAAYSMYEEEPDFDDAPEYIRNFKIVWPLLTREINGSKSRRRRGFAQEEPTEKQKLVITACVKYPEASNRDIAQITGVSKSAVNQTVRRYSKEIAAKIEKETKNQEEEEIAKILTQKESQRTEEMAKYRNHESIINEIADMISEPRKLGSGYEDNDMPF